MIYTPLTNKAINIMYNAHKNQLDKSGVPYVFHPWHIAESMTDETRTVVALLHDVVEDTDITLDDLRKEGFNNDIINAIDLLTHKKTDDYATYIRNIAENEIATDVKISDLTHNLDSSRLLSSDSKPSIKYKIYQASLEYLIRTKELNNKVQMMK